MRGKGRRSKGDLRPSLSRTKNGGGVRPSGSRPGGRKICNKRGGGGDVVGGLRETRGPKALPLTQMGKAPPTGEKSLPSYGKMKGGGV